jgi:hypothetical protein
VSPGSPVRPERSWAHWSSAFASRSATHIPYAVRPGRAESLRPGHMGVARGDGEAPNHLAGDTGAPTADATPGAPDRTKYVTHTPPGMPGACDTVHPIVSMFAKTMCLLSSCEPLRYASACHARRARIHGIFTVGGWTGTGWRLRLRPPRRVRVRLHVDLAHRPVPGSFRGGIAGARGLFVEAVHAQRAVAALREPVTGRAGQRRPARSTCEGLPGGLPVPCCPRSLPLRCGRAADGAEWGRDCRAAGWCRTNGSAHGPWSPPVRRCRRWAAGAA